MFSFIVVVESQEHRLYEDTRSPKEDMHPEWGHYTEMVDQLSRKTLTWNFQVKSSPQMNSVILLLLLGWVQFRHWIWFLHVFIYYKWKGCHGSISPMWRFGREKSFLFLISPGRLTFCSPQQAASTDLSYQQGNHILDEPNVYLANNMDTAVLRIIQSQPC